MSSYKIDLVLISSTLLILFTTLPHLTWLVLTLAIATILTGLGFSWKFSKIILFHHNILNVTFDTRSYDEYPVSVNKVVQRPVRKFLPRRGPAPRHGGGRGGPRRPPRPTPRPSRPGSPRPGSPRPGKPRPIRAGKREYLVVHGPPAKAHAIRLHNSRVSCRDAYINYTRARDYRDRLQRQEPPSGSETLRTTSRQSSISPGAERRFISAVNKEMNGIINVETENSE